MDKIKLKLPNFLIVGAAKSGTSSLYHYLKQHPKIYMTEKENNKETHFFIEPKNILGIGPGHYGKGIIINFYNYKKLYQSNTFSKYIASGEASVSYLYFFEQSIPNIIRYLKNPKIIIILRNPINRAFSNYLHHVRDGLEDLSFEEALKSQKKRKEKNWWWGYQFTDLGFYYHQVKAYLDNFDQVKIYLFDDLKKDTLSLVKDMYGFLGVDTSFTPDVSIKYNVSGIPKNKFIHKFLKKPNILKSIVKPVVKTLIPYKERRKVIEKIKMKNLQKPQIKPETREYLKNLYREDILKLQDLIKRDLSIWLE